MRLLASSGLVLALALPLAAQQPAARDTTARDSAKVTLPELTVTVTRSPETVVRVPAAVGVVSRRDIQGAQATLGLDEALANIPGVYVANRYNYSVDQRLAIRGAGARANFGVRGIKVLLDGIPQTLPDGQSQLTNVDFANLQRIEVIRGASSSLYGNASGGVVALTSEGAGAAPFSQSVRVEGGSFGLFKIQGRSTTRRGPLSGVLSVSRTEVDGFRQHSATEFTQLTLNGDYLAGDKTLLGVRVGYTDAPKAENPGALTATEVDANPDSAAGNNILREADKDVNQLQLAVTAKRFNDRGEFNVAVFGISRNLENWLATPPPQGTGPTAGTYAEIDRAVGGIRLSGDQRLGGPASPVRLVGGLDVQRMRDDRTNARAVAGVPDTLILDQREIVTEIGPFLQLHYSPTPDVVISAGGRYDAVKFEVQDHFQREAVPTDNSGDRTMSSFSGNLGVVWTRDARFSPYLNVSNSFETPTTTELVNQPNSTGGFNTLLDPQRTMNYEVGARGTLAGVTYSVAGYVSRVTDAIVQYREVSGRGYFTNAGKVKNDGLELGLSGRATRWLTLFGNYTYSNFRFGRYRIVNQQAGTVDTLDNNQVPGVPKGFVRLGLRAGPVRGVALDVDHTMATSMFADDLNTLYVAGLGGAKGTEIDGLGRGVTNVRISWEGRAGGAWLRPFLGINNLFDRDYVGSFTVNGTFGRVFETAPGRNYYLGGEIGWAAR